MGMIGSVPCVELFEAKRGKEDTMRAHGCVERDVFFHLTLTLRRRWLLARVCFSRMTLLVTVRTAILASKRSTAGIEEARKQGLWDTQNFCIGTYSVVGESSPTLTTAHEQS